MARIRSLHHNDWDEAAKSAGPFTHFYVLQEGDDGPIKVGISRNAFWRRDCLQSGNHRRLHLRAVYWCLSRLSAATMEQKVLDAFSAHRVSGEWIAASLTEVVDYCGEVI